MRRGTSERQDKASRKRSRPTRRKRVEVVGLISLIRPQSAGPRNVDAVLCQSACGRVDSGQVDGLDNRSSLEVKCSRSSILKSLTVPGTRVRARGGEPLHFRRRSLPGRIPESMMRKPSIAGARAKEITNVPTGHRGKGCRSRTVLGQP